MTSRAKTNEQKRLVIERVLAVWQKNPDLRLGQLLINATSGLDNDHTVRKMFYVEDDALAERLELLMVPIK